LGRTYTAAILVEDESSQALFQNGNKGASMKNAAVVCFLLAFPGLASAQNPDPSKWMCRNAAESGGFIYQGETVFGTQACRPIPQAEPANTQAAIPNPPPQSQAFAAPSAQPATPAEPTPTNRPSPAAPPAAASYSAPVAGYAPQVPPANSVTAAPASTAVQPTGFILEDGTPVHLVLSQNLSSADATTGETVEFEVVDDVVVGGYVVIPHGSTAWATITDAEHKRRMGRAGKLNLNIDKVRLADGEKAMLRAVKDTSGGTHTGAMVGAMVATSLVVWPAAPLFLMMHGKDVTIPKGTNINAFVQGDITLDGSRFQKQLAVAR
jgi:hypothetical protein